MRRLTTSTRTPPRRRSAASSNARLVAAHPVTQYVERVRSGAEVAGPLVRLACARHGQDMAAGRWTFDVDRADHVLEFFPQFLRLPDTLDAEGFPRPFRLLPFQQFILGSLFGWIGEDGYRRFRDGYIETGKGSGKTPLLAGVGLYGLTMAGEQAAEIYSAAVDRDQAMIMFRDATRLVAASPALSTRVKVSVGNLGYAPTMSFFRCFSREQGQRSGYRPYFVLIDELHEHPTGEIVTKAKAGLKRRPDPLVLEITNSGVDRASICWAHHEHARRVLEGVVEDERFFAYVCALDEGDDPLTMPQCWPKTNPGMGVTVTEEYLARQVQNARNIKAETNAVLRLNFCVWTQATTREFNAGQWLACGSVVPDEELEGQPCYAGLDLGQNDDLSALVLVWPLADGRVVARPTFWVPRATLEAKRNRPYDVWERAGVLRVTNGASTDMDLVEAEVLAQAQHWGVRELAYDKRFAEQLRQHLEGAGLTCIDTPQGFQLNEAILMLRTLVREGRLCHGGDPVLAWMADNTITREGQRGDVRLDKPASADKIDGIAALCMALDRVVRRGQEVPWDDPNYRFPEIAP